jgi:formylglycine-generating enzyme required for sulfatase activity
LDAQPTRAAYTRHPWRTDIVSRVFCIGGKTTGGQRSAWDANWMANYGGFDDPDPAQRTAEFTPKGFTPGLNPFYVALPYNDCLSYEEHKPEAAKIIPWFKKSFVKPGRSVLRGTWLAIRYGDKVCYAQWEDCGPFQDNDSDYVFGTARPRNREQNGAAIDLSPSVRDYLNLTSGEKVDWRFVDVGEIPAGPWSKLGMNNHFVRIKELRDRQQQHLTVGQSEELRRQRSVAFSNRDTSSAQPLVGPSSVTLVQSSKRVALVIGNSAYSELAQSMQLSSPKNDATDVADALRSLGYTLVNDGPIIDASRDAITTATEQFATAARDAEAAVFYFSGHGVQVGDDNYLLPSDTPKLTGLSTLNNRAVLLRNSIMVALEEADAKTKVVILDCCRDNPFSAQLETALAQVGKSVKTKSVGEITGYGPGFYLAFATSPGQTAADGNGARNSPFTAAMLQALPGGASKDIDFYFREVKAKLPRDQVSWTNHSLSTTFSLAPGGGGGTVGMVVTPPPQPPPQPPPTPTDPLASVSKNTPFTNGLGMKFVPAGSPGVLFSIWETRVKDFEAFVEDSGHDAVSVGTKAYTMESGPEWKKVGGSWRDPRFPGKQSGEHPVVCVSYLDADAFCVWLTKKDRASGKIPAGASYRLPTDSEWSRAVGGSEFPWGDNYPPTSSDGNYAGVEAMVGAWQGRRSELAQAGFRDGSARTSAVGMFEENRFGLYDMGGNVLEWCGSWFTADLNDEEAKKAIPFLANDMGGQTWRVLRGASWINDERVLLRSAYRNFGHPLDRYDGYGFRVVLVVAGG